MAEILRSIYLVHMKRHCPRGMEKKYAWETSRPCLPDSILVGCDYNANVARDLWEVGVVKGRGAHGLDTKLHCCANVLAVVVKELYAVQRDLPTREGYNV
jgi:hypothetical protein